jgi:hypothetical protein
VEVLLLQRQHREAMKAKHTALLQEYHAQQLQQQEQQQQQQLEHHEGQQQQQQRQHPLTLLTASELSEVKVWDAFFDATLQVGVLPAALWGVGLNPKLWHQPA